MHSTITDLYFSHWNSMNAHGMVDLIKLSLYEKERLLRSGLMQKSQDWSNNILQEWKQGANTDQMQFWRGGGCGGSWW